MQMVRHVINLMLPLILGLGVVVPAWANDITIMSSSLSSRTSPPEGLYLDVNVEFDLPRSVQDALNRGIPLYFITEFSIEHQRWYWVNKPIIEASLMTRLSQSFDSLSETLTILKSLHGWRVSENPFIDSPEDCVAEVQVRLDTEQLPLPMQVTIGENDWDLTSDWHSVDFDQSVTNPQKDNEQ